MKLPGLNYRQLVTGFSTKETFITLGVLLVGLTLTILLVIFTRKNLQKAELQDFEYACNALRTRIDTRLDEHAQLLSSGEALFAVSDTVTMEAWHEFYTRTRISTYLPGIQGFGFAKIIPSGELESHVGFFRSLGFRDYKITPDYKRDIYTSIIYLEPFTGRNLLAFGYDMFSEPVRRQAMESARDSNLAQLSGKVTLVQETGVDVQAGVLMYVPVYRRGMPTATITDRRAAIMGWVYSPYRMKDLMIGIQGSMEYPEGTPLRFKIYDGEIIDDKYLLYSEDHLDNEKSSYALTLPVDFNGKKWTIVFLGEKDTLSSFRSGEIFVLISGIIITFLLFILSTMQISANIRTKQIGELNVQLEKLNKDKDRFIAVLSHDLKSPFTSILGFLEILMNGIHKYSMEQIENHVLTINDAAKNTYNLLEDLLMWTRAHSGKIPFDPHKIRFNEIYGNVAEILIPMAASKNINVRFISEADTYVTADPDMLKAIIRNLLSNAIKFTMPGGEIRVTAEKERDHVIITVADTGIGIAPENLSRLFDISQLMSTPGTAREKGSGLGLILCKEFVERHGGHIRVKSEPGKGSEFRFNLPF